MKPDDRTQRTSSALVRGLKGKDEDAWRQFYDLYRDLIVGIAVKNGLTENAAEDALQETMLAACRNIERFVVDRSRGSFRAWLLTMARWRILDQLPRGSPVEKRGEGHSDEGTSRTSTVERVPDPGPAHWEEIEKKELEKRLWELALIKLQCKVGAARYQIFHLLVVEEKPAPVVARILGRSVQQIYLTKHRVLAELKKIVKCLRKELECETKGHTFTS